MTEYKLLSAAQISWQNYQRLRLEALQLEPQAFATSYQSQLNQSAADWHNALDRYDERHAWMYFAATDQKLVGMAGAYEDDSDPAHRSAQIIAVYVTPDHRGHGVAKLLLTKLLSELKTAGIEKVILSVNQEQLAAVLLYQALGFKITGQEQVRLGDGQLHDEHLMEKMLL